MNIHIDEKGFVTIQSNEEIDESQLTVHEGRLSILGEGFSFSCDTVIDLHPAPSLNGANGVEQAGVSPATQQSAAPDAP